MVAETRKLLNDQTQFSYTIERSFHGIDYLISVFTLKAELLEIEIEQKCDASRWKGEFSAKYLEEITTKTGNFKRYPVFVRMLKSALEGQSKSVYVEILTYNDLEKMRKQRDGESIRSVDIHRSAVGQGLIPNNKRYLILTYASEFDRVHYPLPLTFEETPDPDRLRQVICELRSEIESLRKGTREERIVKSENRSRENSTKRQNATNDGALDCRNLNREIKLAYKERDVLQNRLESSQLDLERERCSHRRSIRKSNNEIEKLAEELRMCQLEIKKVQQQNRELTRQLDIFQRSKPQAHAHVPLSDRSLRRSNTETPTSTSRRSLGRRSSGAARQSHSPAKSSDFGYRSSGSEGSRSGSTSSRRRFNPTAYIQQQQEKQKHVERQRRRHSAGFGSGRDSSRESRKSIRNTNNHRRPRNSDRSLSNASNTSKKSNRESSHDRGSVESLPIGSERSISPGRALQQIKAKLHKFTTSAQGGSVKEDSSKTPCEEFDDVDERLVALQKFLHATKTTMTDLRDTQ